MDDNVYIGYSAGGPGMGGGIIFLIILISMCGLAGCCLLWSKNDFRCEGGRPESQHFNKQNKQNLLNWS